MAASAALPLAPYFPSVDTLFFATESSIDQSKAAGLFVHGLLGLPNRCRVIELKQACYSATFALRMAQQFVMNNPNSRILVLASDIARYELGSPAEPTQGAGAVAILVSSNPELLTLDPEAGIYADDVMDFWRPNYRSAAVVEGKTSTRVYLQAVQQTWAHYHELTGRSLYDFDRCCFHTPFTNMAAKAYQQLQKIQTDPAPEGSVCFDRTVAPSLRYNRITGNTYSASLYESFTSLLDHDPEDLSGKNVSFFSYGSGCTAEFFSGTITPGYSQHIFKDSHFDLLEDRIPLTVQQYEDMFNLAVPTDGWSYRFGRYRTGAFRFAGMHKHKRIYEKSDMD
jgi:hydroxymethylglutaryl-CoA synthase